MCKWAGLIGDALCAGFFSRATSLVELMERTERQYLQRRHILCHPSSAAHPNTIGPMDDNQEEQGRTEDP